ncbi:copper amine oxidase N-terminal domain-containing protein [Aneurinibacillus sp. Ricciae_BoGa-3]|uniref:copper amine oxidase N-terminal domain-containing protein n=1 Tax=Aneurinibacillus sp. Ricciae_BoGa-3 TaxID=3022697 RepID=UPI0023426CDE|nr:copper amine oxidase N-terminal domain-containing protein [Aneurinibacillus sp. Ricciae_BoGa-3]WCK54275.1 copper amine oxidase N-terminal domain-containing protein [Aneurinibacillus sp. Ricciae_BoGa-3]
MDQKKINIKKCIISLVLSSCLAVPSYVTASPVKIDGETVSNDAIQYHGRTMVPLRGVLEKMNIQVNFDEQKRMAIASKNNITIQLPIGRSVAYINGALKMLDTPTLMVNGKTYVPLRFITETFDSQVKYDAKTKTVDIMSSVAKKVDLLNELKAVKSEGKKEALQVQDTAYQNTLFLGQNKIALWNLDGKYKTLTVYLVSKDEQSYNQGVEIIAEPDTKEFKIIGATSGIRPLEGLKKFTFDVTGVHTLEIQGVGTYSRIINPTVQ